MKEFEFEMGPKVKEILDERERSVAWLAKKIPYDKGNLCRVLKQRHIHPNILWRISKILEHDFFKYYSAGLRGEEGG